jgi:hypothetical protein
MIRWMVSGEFVDGGEWGGEVGLLRREFGGREQYSFLGSGWDYPSLISKIYLV